MNGHTNTTERQQFANTLHSSYMFRHTKAICRQVVVKRKEWKWLIMLEMCTYKTKLHVSNKLQYMVTCLEVTGWEPKILGSFLIKMITILTPNQYRGTPRSLYASKMRCINTGKTAPFTFTFTFRGQFKMTLWRYCSFWGTAPVILLTSTAFPRVGGVCEAHNDTLQVRIGCDTGRGAPTCVYSYRCEVCLS